MNAVASHPICIWLTCSDGMMVSAISCTLSRWMYDSMGNATVKLKIHQRIRTAR